MASPKKPQDIQEGVYIHADQHVSIEEPPGLTTPLAISQGSHANIIPNLANFSPSSIRSYEEGLTINKWQLPHVECFDWYNGSSAKVEQRLGIEHACDKGSTLSIAPPTFEMGRDNLRLSVSQAEELAKVSRHYRDTPQGLENPMKTYEAAVMEPPDGGFMAWAHAVAGHLVAFNAQGLNMSYGVFQAYYHEFLIPDKSPGQIAWIGSCQIFLIFFMTIVVSPMIDKGRFHLCFNGGSMLLVLSLVLTSFCTEWWQLLLTQGILTGVSMGLIFGSGIIVLMSYFSKHMGVATGIAAAGASTGGIIFPLVGQKLVFKIGFAWTVRVMALIVFLTLIPANIIARQRPGAKAKGPLQMDWAAFRDIPYLLMMAGMFFSFLGIYFGFYYIVSFGETVLKLSPSASVNLLIAMNAANLPGRFLPNLISDACIGPLNTIVPSTFLAALFIFLWIGTSTHTSLLIVACFYGFAAAALQSLYSATIYSFASDLSKLGFRMAMVFVVIGLACLTGAPVGGSLIGRDSGGYLYAQVFAGCSLLCGAMLLLAARVVKTGWGPQRV